ncbi:unnamed protein product [Aspergillus oryzae var. brunneus]|uniref:Unnamed protein product n=2 Tax=Aspergillus oryzae TaxID=5062 RepID=A0AAN4YF49_ASPOZ|nr:unnamed protein product [Aspergillus oryzae]GMG27751.1 unnamed protein product [Aspergillus oryzae]GMG49778.1 unnamed protein product [Aspergillus oryzae var. brunneus]
MSSKAVDPSSGAPPGHNLGDLRLRHHETNEIILIPTPSNDPHDPLNWQATPVGLINRYVYFPTLYD